MTIRADKVLESRFSRLKKDHGTLITPRRTIERKKFNNRKHEHTPIDFNHTQLRDHLFASTLAHSTGQHEYYAYETPR